MKRIDQLFKPTPKRSFWPFKGLKGTSNNRDSLAVSVQGSAWLTRASALLNP
jgi:hypothetical protein